MTIKKFDSKIEKLVKKADIEFVDFTTNTVTIKGVGKKDFDIVEFRGKTRLAIPK